MNINDGDMVRAKAKKRLNIDAFFAFNREL